MLDSKTLEAIAELICGGDVYYRTRRELPIFFRSAGLECPDYDGTSRKLWALERLEEYNKNPDEIKKVILRLANPKEYSGNFQTTKEVIERLNKILKLEGLRVELKGYTPELKEMREVEQALDVMDEEFTFPNLQDISLIIEDENFLRILEHRIEEINKCINSGAYLMAIVGMGSLIEGILLALVEKYPREANKAYSEKGKAKSFEDWKLPEYLDVAHKLGWIKRSRRDFAKSLVEYRNLIHPKKQRAIDEFPDRNICKICWEVVIATINDLIASCGDKYEK